MNGAQLRRELSVSEAIGISVALMAPSMAVNINPQGTAAAVGRAVPLAFALATVGVLLIGYTFVRLCQRFITPGVFTVSSVRPWDLAWVSSPDGPCWALTHYTGSSRLPPLASSTSRFRGRRDAR